MKYLLYLGCTIGTIQYGYELSARETLPKLGVELVDAELNCCGFPMKLGGVLTNLGWLYLGARVMAISEKMGLNILALCNACHLSLCEVKHNLESNGQLKDTVNQLLSSEGLRFEGKTEVRHIIELLHDEIGVEKIREKVVRPLTGLKLAAHYGCHAIRPSSIKRADDAKNPQKLENLMRAVGAEALDYPEKLDCCGAGLLVPSTDTALKLSGFKLRALKRYGCHGMVNVCPYCQMMYDSKQGAISAVLGCDESEVDIPSFYITQLLGLAFGIDEKALGLHLNLSPVMRVLEGLKPIPTPLTGTGH